MRRPALLLLVALVVGGCTDSSPPVSEPSRPPVPSTQRTSTPSHPSRASTPLTLTTRAKKLPVGTRSQLSRQHTLTLHGIGGASPLPHSATRDGRLFVPHQVTNTTRPERLRLNAVQVVDPHTGRGPRLTAGFPHKSQVIAVDSHGPWITWIEGDSIYLDSVGWHLYSWNTRTGAHHHLASFHDLHDLRGTPQGDYVVALWHHRAWMVGAHRPADSQQALYSIPLTGGRLRREANDESAPFTAGNRLYTYRASARTRPTTLLERTRPDRPPRVVYRSRHPHTEVKPLGRRLVSIHSTPDGQAAELIRPGHPPRTLLNAPAEASYWITGRNYVAFHLGNWPHAVIVYNVDTREVFRATSDPVAYADGSRSNLLTWFPPHKVQSQTTHTVTARVGPPR